MKMIWDAAISHTLETRKAAGTVIRLNEIGGYVSRDCKVPHCPLGTKDYAPFTVDSGPRCPNAPAHSGALVADKCSESRAFVWDVAISHCREQHLSWDTLISKSEMKFPLTGSAAEATRFHGKLATWSCPLGSNDYPSFVLREGPRCPYDDSHNQGKVTIRFNTNYFDLGGNLLTNRLW
jgi:hypothetical protein